MAELGPWGIKEHVDRLGSLVSMNPQQHSADLLNQNLDPVPSNRRKLASSDATPGRFAELAIQDRRELNLVHIILRCTQYLFLGR